MPEIQFAPSMTASPVKSNQIIPEDVKRKIMAAQLLQEMAADGSKPIYSKNAGYAKLLAGALGGAMEGYETNKENQAQATSWDNISKAMGGNSPGGPPASTVSNPSSEPGPKALGAALSDEISKAVTGPSESDAPKTTLVGNNPDMNNLPRGLRNNNPGNIEDGSFAKKMPGYAGTDGRFAKFAALENGQGAMDSLLASYGARGINNVSGVINRWAPASDGNPVGNYASSVAKAAGVDPNAQIDLGDPALRQKLITGMSQFENGRPVPMAQPIPNAVQGENQAQPIPNTGTQPQAQPAQGMPQPMPQGIDRNAAAAALRDPRVPTEMKMHLLQQMQPSLKIMQTPDGSIYGVNERSGAVTPIMKVAPKGVNVKIDERLADPATGQVLLGSETKPQVVPEGGALVGASGAPIYKSDPKLQSVPENNRLVNSQGGIILPSDKQQFRPLTDPAERQKYGIPSTDKRVFQVGPDNKVYEAGGNLVSIENKAESALEAGRGTGLAKRLNAIADDGADAHVDIQTVGRLRQLASAVDPGTKTALLERIRASTGIPLDPNADNVQAASAIIKYMMPRMRVAGAGTTSDRDLAAFEASLPSLTGTPGGNQIIMDTLEGMAQFKKSRAGIAADWQNGDLSAKAADQKMNELPNPFERFNAARQPQQGAAATAPVGAATPQAPTPQEPTATNPQTGQKIILKDGKWVPLQ